MIPTPQMQQLIKRQLTDTPLRPDEMRRIEKMGDLYASLAREGHPNEYVFLYSMTIENTKYYFFSFLSDEKEAKK